MAPRDGIVDSLPYEVGDEPPVGAPLAVLLVGKAPHARVYIPEPIRADVGVGQRARVFVDGLDEQGLPAGLPARVELALEERG